METAEQQPLLGRLLDGRYRLDSLIARGGMATVYRATDTRLDRTVAVKVMHRALAEDPDFVARFTREAKAAARVQAPEVVAVHDAGTDGETGLAYLVMENVQGINLRQLLLERGALAPARAVSLMVPVARALAAAHAAGLVHRDIKPENVLLSDDGRVKVTDFGLARAVETSNLTQTTGLLIGTVAYLAPEQVDKGTADARTDVYAAGVLLWELLTGTPPYGGESPLSVAYKHVHEDVPPPSTAVAGIPPELDALVVRATRRDPDQRPRDGGELLTGLQALAPLPTDAPVVTTEHPTLVVPRATTAVPRVAVPKAASRRRRRGLVIALVLALLAVLALGGGYYLGSYRYTKAPRVLDLSASAATARLEKAGLHAKLGPKAFSESVRAGDVMAQDPGPGGRVRKGGTVTLTVSKGLDRVQLPSFAGQSVRVVTTKLQALRLTVAATSPSEYSDTVDKGLVVRTDPPAGATLRPGTVVTLVLSLGKEQVQVTDTTGKTQDEAESILQGLGFKTAVTQAFSDEVDPGRVISQNPSTGSADKGSTVNLVVSKGPDVVAVPDVRNKKPDDAKRILEDAGFKTRRQDVIFSSGKRVYATDPGAGTKARRGSTVTYYVY